MTCYPKFTLSQFCLHFEKKTMKVFSQNAFFRNPYAESTGLEMFDAVLLIFSVHAQTFAAVLV